MLIFFLNKPYVSFNDDFECLITYEEFKNIAGKKLPPMISLYRNPYIQNCFKGIGLHRLSLISEERGWRD